MLKSLSTPLEENVTSTNTEVQTTDVSLLTENEKIERLDVRIPLLLIYAAIIVLQTRYGKKTKKGSGKSVKRLLEFDLLKDYRNENFNKVFDWLIPLSNEFVENNKEKVNAEMFTAKTMLADDNWGAKRKICKRLPQNDPFNLDATDMLVIMDRYNAKPKEAIYSLLLEVISKQKIKTNVNTIGSKNRAIIKLIPQIPTLKDYSVFAFPFSRSFSDAIILKQEFQSVKLIYNDLDWRWYNYFKCIINKPLELYTYLNGVFNEIETQFDVEKDSPERKAQFDKYAEEGGKKKQKKIKGIDEYEDWLRNELYRELDERQLNTYNTTEGKKSDDKGYVLEAASALFASVNLGYTGDPNKKRGNFLIVAEKIKKQIALIIPMSVLLHDAELHNEDCCKFISSFNEKQDVFTFADTPYLIEGNCDCVDYSEDKKADPKCKPFGEKKMKNLFNTLLNSNTHFLVYHKRSPLFNKFVYNDLCKPTLGKGNEVGWKTAYKSNGKASYITDIYSNVIFVEPDNNSDSSKSFDPPKYYSQAENINSQNSFDTDDSAESMGENNG